MSVEVEVKARYSGGEKKLTEQGARYIKTVRQEDIYFQHPERDFRKTDEALRIRQQENLFYITYKGPKLDDETKTRTEYEFPVEKECISILEALGFREAGKVVKERRVFHLEDMTVCLDDVEGLGSFIEVEASCMEDKEKIFSFLGKLGIDRKQTIRESYLELLSES